MDLFELLRRDHDELRNLLEHLIAGPDPQRESIRDTQDAVWDLLLNHTRMEEEFLYPELCEISDAKKLTEHAYQEHERARQLIDSLPGERPLSDGWKRQCRQLLDALNDHIREEENQMFPLIRQHLDTGEIGCIYHNMLEFRKHQLQAKRDLAIEPKD